jgi:hypothetical protein
MVVRLDRKGFEPALPDVSTRSIMPQVAANMSGQQPVHPAAEVAIGAGPEDQVKVFGHQTIAEHANRNS